jgi:hypothetical protein
MYTDFILSEKRSAAQLSDSLALHQTDRRTDRLNEGLKKYTDVLANDERRTDMLEYSLGFQLFLIATNCL